MEPNGCKMPDFCHHGKFCPVHCSWEKQEMSCPGFWDPKTGEQTTPDTCIPIKDEMNGCPNHCPIQCSEKDIMCPGKMDPNGCKMSDTCHAGKFCPADCDWEKQMMCPGKMEPNGCKMPDFCHHGKFCPVHCSWEKQEMSCPGFWDPK